MSQTITRQRSFTSSDSSLKYSPRINTEDKKTTLLENVHGVLYINKTSKLSAKWCIIHLFMAALFYLEMKVMFEIFKYIPFSRNVMLNLLFRGGFSAAATSKMERFVIIVNGWKPLTIITKRSILDVAAALDPPLLLVRIQTLPQQYLNSLTDLFVIFVLVALFKWESIFKTVL